MAIIVEDGTGVANANSYVSASTLESYCDDRAITLADGDEEAALIRASAAIDNRYRPRFVGYRAHRRLQGLEWPRAGAYYYTPQAGDLPYGRLGGVGYGYGYGYGPYEYDQIATTTIPVEIINATCEAAVRELIEPGAMAPDLDRGNAIKMLKAGSVQIEYEGGAPHVTLFLRIDQALSALLTQATPFSGRAVRA